MKAYSLFEHHGYNSVLSKVIKKCAECGFEYHIDGNFKNLYDKLKNNNCISEIEDFIQHSKSLASIADKIRMNHPKHPPIKGLFHALNQAKWFVHFTSYGITHVMIGALKLTSQRVPVRGTVSLSSNDAVALPELSGHELESPLFEVKTFLGSDTYSELPHQKLIVIDGLLAFKGSVNLSQNAWRKIQKNHEDLEIITK